MIVREVLQHPELLQQFDWFNDYKDTRSFLVEMKNRGNPDADSLIQAMDVGNDKFIADWRDKSNLAKARSI